MEKDGNAGLFAEFHAAILAVPDMQRARGWYEGVLGFSPCKVAPDNALTVYHIGRRAHVCLYCPPPGMDDVGEGQGACSLNFRSSDVEKTRKTLVEAGVGCAEIQEWGAVKWFRLQDPFGNRIDCCQFGSDWLEHIDD